MINYVYEDIKQIVNFICSKQIPLQTITFENARYLTIEDIMVIIKAQHGRNNKGLIIKTTFCGFNMNMIEPVLKYIEKNKLKIKIEN